MVRQAAAAEPMQKRMMMALEDFNIVLDWYPNAIHSFLYVAQEKAILRMKG